MVTLRVKENSKQAKAFLEFVKSFSFVEIVDEGAIKKKTIKKNVVLEESPYNPEFVKMVKDAEKRGEYKSVDPKDIWGSLGLK